MAEIEISILQQQCLDRRIPDEQSLKQEVAAWGERRNGQKATINWRFSLDDASTKLMQLYPSTSQWSTTSYFRQYIVLLVIQN